MRFDVDVAVQDSTIIAPGDCDFLTEIKGSSIYDSLGDALDDEADPKKK